LHPIHTMNLISDTLHAALEGRQFNRLLEFEAQKYRELEENANQSDPTWHLNKQEYRIPVLPDPVEELPVFQPRTTTWNPKSGNASPSPVINLQENAYSFPVDKQEIEEVTQRADKSTGSFSQIGQEIERPEEPYSGATGKAEGRKFTISY